MIDTMTHVCKTLRRALRAAGARFVLSAVLTVAACAGPALAQEEGIEHDGRLEGYAEKVIIDGGESTALTWLLLVFLGMVSLSVMFKNARRSHLD